MLVNDQCAHVDATAGLRPAQTDKAYACHSSVSQQSNLTVKSLTLISTAARWTAFPAHVAAPCRDRAAMRVASTHEHIRRMPYGFRLLPTPSNRASTPTQGGLLESAPLTYAAMSSASFAEDWQGGSPGLELADVCHIGRSTDCSHTCSGVTRHEGWCALH
jgi:hypothetical protein